MTVGLLVGSVAIFLVYVGQHIFDFLPYAYQLAPDLKTDPLVLPYLQLPIVWPDSAYITGVVIVAGTLVGGVLLTLKSTRLGLVVLGLGSIIGTSCFWATHIQPFSGYAQGSTIALMQKTGMQKILKSIPTFLLGVKRRFLLGWQLIRTLRTTPSFLPLILYCDCCLTKHYLKTKTILLQTTSFI
jgi:hypothetical protein